MLEELAELQRKSSRVSEVKDVADLFFQHLERSQQGIDGLGGLIVENRQIVINFLDHELSASARTVAITSGRFAIEFPFMVNHEECEGAICCFYLSGGGRLFTDPELVNPICDYNNAYITQHILGYVGRCVLDSSLYKPAGAGL